MNETELLLSMKDFEQRYGITRANIYKRISALAKKGYPMEPLKQGTRALYSMAQTILMDQLDGHLKEGNDSGSFPDPDGRVQLSQPVDSSLARQTVEHLARRQDAIIDIDRSPATLGVAALVESIAGKIAEIIPSPQPDPLANLRLLQEACEQEWLLSSSQLAPLLGVKSLSGASFERYGFTFARTGRNGAESAWKITKVRQD